MERVVIYKDRNGKIKEEIAHGMSKEILRRLKDGEVFYENGVKVYKIDEDFYKLEYNINSTLTSSDLMRVRVTQFELLESEFDKWVN